MRLHFLPLLSLLLTSNAYAADKVTHCESTQRYLKPACQRWFQIWEEGHPELYLSGYAWHNRYTYAPERLREKRYNELAWGGGLGQSGFDEKGNWQGLYAIAFLDSHKNIQPVIGYAYLWMAHLNTALSAGLGYTLFVTERPDIARGIPFPAALPWASIFYKRLAVKMTYIPGSHTNGNVLYFIGSYSF